MNDALLSMELHMDEVAPNECVGLLLEDKRVVKLFNQAQSPHRFFVNPQQLLDRNSELTAPVSALYHSHPQRAAIPSGEDERMMEYLITVWPDAYHIILSPEGHQAYHVVDDVVTKRDELWLQL